MAAPAFRRLVAEHATAVAWNPWPANAVAIVREAEHPPPEIYADLHHGDLVYEPDGHHNANKYVVIEDAGGKRVEQLAAYYGFGHLPVGVTVSIEDPVAFYAVCADSVCLGGIELDAAAHQRLLTAASGGRAVHSSREVWWSRLRETIHIWSPNSSDIPEGRRSVALDRATPDEYLGDAAELEIDPITAQLRAQNKTLYEVTAHQHFLSLQGGSDVLSREVPLPNVNCGWLSDEAFVSAEPDPEHKGKVLAVHTESDGRTFVYKPRVMLDKGVYGGVALWVSEDPRRGFRQAITGMLQIREPVNKNANTPL